MDEFNKGIYDYIIATDENLDSSKSSKCILQTSKKMRISELLCIILSILNEHAFFFNCTSATHKNKNKNENKGSTKDKEYGVSRGIDFQGMLNFVSRYRDNFQLPCRISFLISIDIFTLKFEDVCSYFRC